VLIDTSGEVDRLTDQLVTNDHRAVRGGAARDDRVREGAQGPSAPRCPRPRTPGWSSRRPPPRSRRRRR